MGYLNTQTIGIVYFCVMAYQAIVDLIRDAANEVNPNKTFVHGRRSDGSLEYDGEFPQIHLYPFISRPNTDNRNIVVSEIVMGFWGQDSPETTNDEREEIIAAMDVLSNSFLDELDLSADEITNIRKEPQYRTLSATLSGYAITFTLTTFESPC